MTQLTRRRILAGIGGSIGLAGTAIGILSLESVLPFRPVSTISVSPTREKLLPQQSELTGSEGELSAIVLPNETAVDGLLNGSEIPKGLRKQLNELETGYFWTVVGSILPIETDFELGKPGYRYNSVVFQNATGYDGDSNGDANSLRYHYVFKKWKPTLGIRVVPEAVDVAWAN